MARTPRTFVPEVSFHVFQRGINRAAIVGGDADYERLLAIIANAATAHDLRVHAHAVMKTHYHLIVTPPAEGVLSRAMKEINGRYTRYFNRQYGRIGTMWNERYGALLLDDERYGYNCLRYVDLNPVHAHIVDAPEDYAWSSYRVHALGESCAWHTPHPLYLALGQTSEVRQAAYRALCATPMTETELALQMRPPLSKRPITESPSVAL